MKRARVIIRLFILTAMLISSVDSFAGRTQIRIEHYTAGEGAPKLKTQPIICYADNEAGYVELTFRRDFGVVGITIGVGNGDAVNETTIDTRAENFVTLLFTDTDDSYTINIESNAYSGKGNIH